ncbi:hypothetical protein ACQP6U_18055 [Acinetobacter baumannii]|uniref:hypothetical protein n=1 Tax=Acinetobacter baumannii TaxID=470 RepID=UPI003D0019A0
MEKELKKKLYENVACIGLWILVITLVFLFIAKYFFGQCIDISLLKDVFSISATIFAALVAVLLFTDWRIQKNFELKYERLNNIISSLSELRADIILLRNDILKLETVKNNLEHSPSILEHRNPEVFSTLLKINGSIFVYSKLTKDEKLNTLYNSFEKICFIIFGLNEKIVKDTYKNYLENAYKNDIIKDPSIEFGRLYNNNEKLILKNDIESIENILSIKFRRSIPSINFDESKLFFDYVEQAKDEVEEMINYCVEEMNPK